MYRPNGIGDCFLVSFTEGDQTRHMLIDCGVLKGTDEATFRMKHLVKRIGDVTGMKLDVLVATHEHWDHISGFNQAREEFEEIDIEEVWLGWTEKKNDPRASELAKKREKARKAVENAAMKLSLSAAPSARDRLKGLEGLRQFSGHFGTKDKIAPENQDEGNLRKNSIGRRTTAQALEWARSGTGGEVKYLEPGGQPVSIPGINGVRVFVLGPPLAAEAIRKNDPSQRNPEVYHLAGGMELSFLAALERIASEDSQNTQDSGSPFDDSFRISFEKAEENEFFRQTYFSDLDWREIDLDWLGSAEGLALQLDSDTNNTSLVIAIELVKSGQVFLFPGDAQVGNWLSWQDLSWTITDNHGETIKITAQDLLKRTVLYKVGHHASHNATLREKGLEQMLDSQLSALIPVYQDQASTQGKKGWEMPFKPLLERLDEKTSGRIYRTDHGTPQGMPKHVEGVYTETEDFIELIYRD
jgi:beta-lactamase superfamily II metal-dependent hydrolase